MDLRDYWHLLRGSWRFVALCAAIGLCLAAAVTLTATPVYRAESQVFVSTSASDSAAGLQQGGQFAQQRVKSYADIVDSPRVTTAVIEQLGLDVTPRQLGEQITAEAPTDTVLINIAVEDEVPGRAQAVANAVAERFTVVAGELETPANGAPSPVVVSVVRPADLPTDPVSPRRAVDLALGLLLGLAVGVGVAVLRETLDTSIKGSDEIRTALGLPTLGAIAYDPDAASRPLIVHSDPQSTRAEAFRQLRTNLQFVDVDARPRSIVITSSVPEEGKSTTTVNLAIALAQAGLKVILVDADLRRPRLAEYLGIEGAAGLTDALVGRAPLDALLQPWGEGELHVLTSGRTPPNPSELLGSRHMRELLTAMEERSDLVLLDAPPLLPVTDAAVMASFASGAILVVRSGRTRREQAVRAAEALRGVDAHIYGSVLNMTPTKGPGAEKYGYYGYGYETRTDADELAEMLSDSGADDDRPRRPALSRALPSMGARLREQGSRRVRR